MPVETPGDAATEEPFSLSNSDYSGYLDERGELVLTAYFGSEAEASVPESIDGYAVAEIGEEMFAHNAHIRSVALPESLRRISDRAFYDCTNLEKVTIPDGIEFAGEDLFKDCKKLEHIVLCVTRDAALISDHSYRHTRENQTFVPSFSGAFTDFIVKGSLTVDADYALNADCEMHISSTLKVLEGRTLTNYGSIWANGEIFLSGTLITCAGAFSGETPEGAFIQKHATENGTCIHCHRIYPIQCAYTGGKIEKTYDGTKTIALDCANFTVLDGAAQIAAVAAELDSADAGARTAHITFTMTDASLAVEPLDLPATVTKRALTITPKVNQSKVYGALDPEYYSGSVKGLIKGDKLSGSLSREAGESVGAYKITLGTLRCSDNYTIALKSGTFTIAPRPISETVVSGIANQKYTGFAVEPVFAVRVGDETLIANVDYKFEYVNNVQPGTATLRLMGMGNYTGVREIAFRILNTGSGMTYTGIESPGVPGLANPSGDPEGDAAGDTVDLTRVQLGYADIGNVVFNRQNQPQAVDFYLDVSENALHLSPLNANAEMHLTLSRSQIESASADSIVYSDGEISIRFSAAELLSALSDGDALSVYVREIALPRVGKTALYIAFCRNDAPTTLDNAHIESPVFPVLLIQNGGGAKLLRSSDAVQSGLYIFER